MQQTIPVNDGYISSYVGSTPSTGPFEVDFPFFSLNDVVVARQADGSAEQEALTRGADYDLTSYPTEDGSFWGGTITLYLEVANTTIIRFRNTPVERLSNFPLQGFFSRLSLNAELNRITVWMQELNAMLSTTSESSTAHAPLQSPVFLGDPRGPTPPPGDNDTSLATTAFVNSAMVGLGAAVPAGVVVDYAGVDQPPGWLMCWAQVLERAAYPGLFAAIGTGFNLGGETGTQFRLPDVRGRVVAAADVSGSNRLTNAIANSDTVGASGGTERHTLSQLEIPAHSHNVADHAHEGSAGQSIAMANAGSAWGYVSASGTGLIGYVNSTGSVMGSLTTDVVGSTQPHTNVQPTLIMNKIIKT